ncbi:MAG: nitrilase-related carbon-nitrogen hydrolase [Chitinophagaceae bacterium]
MKIAIAQQNYHIGNFEANTDKIIQSVRDARMAGADLAVFSELCVCGYFPRDFLEFEDFIQRCTNAVQQIAAETRDIGVLIGAPSRNPSRKAKICSTLPISFITVPYSR